MMTPRDLLVLQDVARYYILSRPQIQDLRFDTDRTGRVTRRRLQYLVTHGLLNRHRAQVVYPNSAPAGSVYYPSEKGCRVLTEQTGDERYLLTPTQCPQPHHVAHWLACSQTHILLDRAIALQDQVTVDDFFHEWDVVNKDAPEPDKHFRLYTLLSKEPKLVCAPDMAFLLTVGGLSKVFYVEQDRATSSTSHVAARKCKGFAAMAERRLHCQHFPSTNVDSFSVLCLTPSPSRRDLLRKAFADKPGASLWRFASMTDLTPETFLHSTVLYPCAGEPMPLVNVEALVLQTATSTPAGELREGPVTTSQLRQDKADTDADNQQRT